MVSTLRCIHCGVLFVCEGEDRVPLCRICSQKLLPLEGERCEKCGRPLISEKQTCTKCRGKSFYFLHNRSVYDYRGVAKSVLKKYKFEGLKHLVPFISEGFHRVLCGYTSMDALVPVPGNPHSVKTRGWDQTLLIGEYLERKYKYPVRDILTRKRSKEQKSLGYSSRMSNLKGKISVKKRCGSFHRIVLIDDVFTTGATGNECARVILDAYGCSPPVLVTFAMD